MEDSDVLDNNPKVTRRELEALHGQVFGWALSRCDYNRAAAEDLMQQTYVELLSGKARFDGRSSLKTFVFGVVQKRAARHFRRLAARLRFAQTQPREEPVTHLEDYHEHAALWAAVAALPARQRDIIELVFCREFTVAQASAVMGVSLGTGRVHYDRAKKALKRRLENDHDAG